MKGLVPLLKNFIKEDFNPFLYLYWVVFLVVTISINYTVDFEDSILDSYYKTPQSFVFYTLFYMFGYYAISIPKLIIEKKSEILKTSIYWFRSAFFISLIGFSAYFYFHRDLDFTAFSYDEKWFVIKLLAQIKSLVVIVIPLLLFWFLFDRNKEHFYGFKLKDANLKPYMIMLLLMLPLIFGVSFLDDFQDTYPILKPWEYRGAFGWELWQYSAVFEPLYGLSFLSVEMIFRGALVIGMAKILGKDAILPMVTMYAFLHFGKPLGETMGSIFGGYILGVIALKKEHIFGGCIIHIGVAYLMELTALWQEYFN